MEKIANFWILYNIVFVVVAVQAGSIKTYSIDMLHSF